MFNKGDYVVNSNNGICKIDGIVTMNTSNGNKEYYLLIPLNKPSAQIYIPVDSATQRIRYAMNREEATQLINSIKDINETYIENEKEREKVYKAAVSSCDPQKLVGIIKTLYLRRLEREKSGKRNTVVDERYFKLAENQLHSELSFALQIEKEQVIQMITQSILG